MSESRRIFLWGEITDDTALKVIKKLRYLGDISKEPISIYIHSEGGDWDAHNAIIDEIDGTWKREVEVWTIAQGKAYSAAAHILTLNQKGYRFATRNTTIMLHAPSIEVESDYTHINQSYMDYGRKQSDEFYKKLANTCGKGTKKFQDFMDKLKSGLWLNAQNAKSYGLIDGIWEFKWEDENTNQYQTKNSSEN